MHDFSMDVDSELWDIILDGSHVPINKVTDGESTRLVPKSLTKYKEVYRKKIEKNFKTKKLFTYGIRLDEYNIIYVYESTKENLVLFENYT